MTTPRHFDVYRLARFLAAEIHRLCERFPRGSGPLRDQLRRGSKSVALNTAEGLGRGKAGEKPRAYVVARGEMLETRAAMDLALACGYVTGAEHERCEVRADHISAMLWKLIERFRE